MDAPTVFDNKIKEDRNRDYPLGYVSTIDGLRGVLPFGVLAAHIQYRYFPSAIVFMNIFFILSAYLITSLLLKDISQSGIINFKRFYLRRMLRLFPPYYALLLIFGLAVTLLVDNPWPHYKDILYSALFISNWIRAFSIETPDWLGHTWSLSIEEQYYLCWPLVLHLLVSWFGSGRRLILAMALLYIALIAWKGYLDGTGASIVRLYNGTDVRADTLLIGCILAVLRTKSGRYIDCITEITRVLFFPMCLLIFIVFPFSLHWQNHNMYTWGSFLVDVCASVFLLGLISNSGTFVHRVFANDVLVFLGKISYPTYLWHYPVFKFMRHYNGSDSDLIIYGVPATYLCACLSYFYIEKPCMHLKRRLS